MKIAQQTKSYSSQISFSPPLPMQMLVLLCSTHASPEVNTQIASLHSCQSRIGSPMLLTITSSPPTFQHFPQIDLFSVFFAKWARWRNALISFKTHLSTESQKVKCRIPILTCFHTECILRFRTKHALESDPFVRKGLLLHHSQLKLLKEMEN